MTTKHYFRIHCKPVSISRSHAVCFLFVYSWALLLLLLFVYSYFFFLFMKSAKKTSIRLKQLYCSNSSVNTLIKKLPDERGNTCIPTKIHVYTCVVVYKHYTLYVMFQTLNAKFSDNFIYIRRLTIFIGRYNKYKEIYSNRYKVFFYVIFWWDG